MVYINIIIGTGPKQCEPNYYAKKHQRLTSSAATKGVEKRHQKISQDCKIEGCSIP